MVKAARQARPRRLLLCLDGVPFEVIEAAKVRGLFDAFGAPSRLLSPFPTMTDVALSTMLGASAPLGYESLYFDREAGKLRGGAHAYFGHHTPGKMSSSYLDELDYQVPLPFEFLIYTAPEALWRADFWRFKERFRAAPPMRDFFAILKGTDGLLHLRGPKRLNAALQALDRILRNLLVQRSAETEIVLFSDHGMNLQENRRIHLKTHLRRCGYEITTHLRGRNHHRSVVIPAFGLCGYAALYCAEGEKVAPSVAEALVTLEGVDFAIHRDDASAVVVRGAHGVARIQRKVCEGGRLYRYEQISGDPLQLAPVSRGLSEDRQLDQRGYASDEAWYTRTSDHIYPDALANLYGALGEPRVRNTADVLASLCDGYYYGASFFSRMARLAATHGNALRASSTAFLMSTHRAFPAYVRAADARPLLRQ